jgi:hypothetical protein
LSKEDRLVLLQAWHEFTAERAPEHLPSVAKLMPKMVKKRRKIDGGWEEYIDPVFPDEENGTNVKLLSLAHEWKKNMEAALSDDEDEED